MTESELIENNLRLVKYVIAKMSIQIRDPAIDFDDVVSAGYIGLIVAAKNFKSELGNAFSTFAVPYIKGYVKRLLIWQVRGVNRAFWICEIMTSIKRKQLEGATPQEISKSLGIKEEQAVMALEELNKSDPVHLDKETNGASLHDLFLNSTDDQTNIFVDEFLNILTERQRYICIGIIEGKELGRTGAEIGLTRGQSNVCMINIRKKLKKYMGIK